MGRVGNESDWGSGSLCERGGFVVPNRVGRGGVAGNAFLGIFGPKTQDMVREIRVAHKIWELMGKIWKSGNQGKSI
jgi:hypothetical protein